MKHKSWTTTKREDALNEQIEHLKTEIETIKANRTIKCTKCEKRTKIKNVTVLQPHWYTPPSGCSGGDYWNTSAEVSWWCPKCGKWERVFGESNLRTKEEVPQYTFIKAHRSDFGEFLDEYDEKSLDEIREANEKRKNRNRT